MGTVIYVNGRAWTPTWSTNSDSPRGVSSEFGGVNPPFLARSGQGIEVTKKVGRGVVSFEQFPSADNDQTLAVRVDDEEFGGADWYEFVISWNGRAKSSGPATKAAQKSDAESDSQPETSAAEKWLALLDARDYSGSWNEASTIYQGAVPEQQFTNAMNTFRKPLGDLLSRKLASSQRQTRMPGAPDGQYTLMQFETSFANKKSAIETVTFMLENEQWKPAGYFIK